MKPVSAELGVFGRVPEHLARFMGDGVRVVRYIDASKLNMCVEDVVPFVWVPLANARSAVVDINGVAYLFAFNNSGCILSDIVIERITRLVERLAELGCERLLLDAVRLPSPVDFEKMLTTCFCDKSLGVNGAEKLMVRLRHVYHNEPRELLALIDDIIKFKVEHVSRFLAIVHDVASAYNVQLEAAVFPYPLSLLVGQDPVVLRRYVTTAHVMLYHDCPGAACFNAEAYSLFRLLQSLGFRVEDILEFMRRATGISFNEDTLRMLPGGIGREHIQKLLELNARVYSVERFTPILWFDEHMLEFYLTVAKMFKRLDLFVPS